jgi:hypothetical protein
VTIGRDEKFAGDVTLSIEGFTTTVDDQTKQPAGFAKNFDLTPMVVKKDQSRATLTFKAKPGVEKGTREAVLRAETTTPAGAKYVLYSQPFPITVK